MIALNPFGPLSPDEFAALVAAPYGVAARAIQKHDPLWGRGLSTGEKRKYRVKLRQMVSMTGFVTVDAESEEEAEHLASAIPDNDVSWDFEYADATEVDSAELAP